MRDFYELNIWQKSHQLTLKIYIATRSFPKDEIYGLTGQIRRSSSSIPANIAEGCGRNGNGEFRYFLTIATGSCSEVEYQLLLSRELHYIDQVTYEELSGLAVQIRKMIYAFIQRLNF